MNARASLIAGLSVAMIALFADSAAAKRISIRGNSTTQVKSRCGGSGGVYFPKTGRNSTYGCMNDDGSGIVCGGKTQKDKKTCDTFRMAPQKTLPTRGEAAEAEAKEKAQ